MEGNRFYIKNKFKFNNRINESTTLVMDGPLLCCVKNELTFQGHTTRHYHASRKCFHQPTANLNSGTISQNDVLNVDVRPKVRRLGIFCMHMNCIMYVCIQQLNNHLLGFFRRRALVALFARFFSLSPPFIKKLLDNYVITH